MRIKNLQFIKFFIKSKFYGNLINFFYRVPLYYAVQRNDLQAVRLLLDFKSDPNVTVKDMSLISIASSKGFSEIVLMLIEAGANLNPPINPPLLTVLESGSKLCLSVLLFERSDEILKEIDGKILLYHAAVLESSLLPVIAKITHIEIQKLKQQDAKKNEIPSFPPKGISPNQKKEINEVLALNESLLPINSVCETIKSIKKVWTPPK